jgi:hypothetical protein
MLLASDIVPGGEGAKLTALARQCLTRIDAGVSGKHVIVALAWREWKRYEIQLREVGHERSRRRKSKKRYPYIFVIRDYRALQPGSADDEGTTLETQILVARLLTLLLDPGS